MTGALDLVQDSLVRRRRTLFSLSYEAVDTMSLDVTLDLSTAPAQRLATATGANPLPR